MVAMVALTLRLLWPGVSTPAEAGGTHALPAELIGEIPICHSGAAEPLATQPATQPPTQPPTQPKMPAHDCALCPVCQAAAGPALLPDFVWRAAPLPAVADGTTWHPPSTGPPRPVRYAARPRGPPAPLV